MSQTKTILIVEERIVERSTCFGSQLSQQIMLLKRSSKQIREFELVGVRKQMPV